jgi:predicted secreted protein
VLELPSNETTGYSWRFRWEPAEAVVEVENRYLADGSDRVGAGGVHRLVVDVRAAGAVVLYAQYGRWWDGGEREPERSVTLRVDDPRGE